MFKKKEKGEIVSKVIDIKKISKTVKGGRKFSFAALCISGNQKGHVGFAYSKAKEVVSAIQKSNIKSVKNLTYISLKNNRTIHHDVKCTYGSTCVLLKKARKGTGIISSVKMKAVFESVGIKDIVAKSINSNNSINIIKATFKALNSICSPRFLKMKLSSNIYKNKNGNS